MSRYIWGVFSLVGISCYLVAGPVRADQLKMECQVANFKGESAGLMHFCMTRLPDLYQSTCSPVHLQSRYSALTLRSGSCFSRRGGRAVFYGITPEGLSPVQIFSLNFASPNMFSYQMGGDDEEAVAAIPQYKARCRRLN